ncbi:hypothetical protein [Streptomyces sp. NPDC089795]|uniref:hypothetical protein n=1 Tax=Streptomyces sp. NPDC089795 TaxID=3155297 RepID=UPI0034413B5A
MTADTFASPTPRPAPAARDAVGTVGTQTTPRPDQTTVVEVDKPARNAEHPTSKPVDLITAGLRNRYAHEALVHEPFGGEHRIREASELLGRAEQGEGAGDVATLGDLLAVAASHAPAVVRDRVWRTADAFEQAARAPGARSLQGRARAGRRASVCALEHAPRAARGGGAAVVLIPLTALVEAVEAAADWVAGADRAGRSASGGQRNPPGNRVDTESGRVGDLR